jgi:hypothetical protein
MLPTDKSEARRDLPRPLAGMAVAGASAGLARHVRGINGSQAAALAITADSGPPADAAADQFLLAHSVERVACTSQTVSTR